MGRENGSDREGEAERARERERERERRDIGTGETRERG